MTQGALFKGVGCALAAGLVWGLVFIAPVLLPGYPAAVLSVGRYLAFGLIALVLALGDQKNFAAEGRLQPILVGAAVVLIGMTFGFNAGYAINPAQRELAWGRLAGSLVVLAAGIALVNHDELGHLSRLGGSPRQLLPGANGGTRTHTGFPTGS